MIMKIGVLKPEEAGEMANAKVARWEAKKKAARLRAEANRAKARLEGGGMEKKHTPIVKPAGAVVLASGRTIAPLFVEYGGKIINRKVIKVGYLEARRLAAEKGGVLPSNVTHDECLISGEWKRIEGLYCAWAREILVYPKERGFFQAGRDVVDSETGWILPGSYIDSVTRARARWLGLLVNPEYVEEDGNRVIIHPKEFAVIHGLIQDSGAMGKIEIEGAYGSGYIPIRASPEELAHLKEDMKRQFFRIAGVGVRPLVRGDHGWGGNVWQYVVAGFSPYTAFGVAVEIPKGNAQKNE